MSNMDATKLKEKKDEGIGDTLKKVFVAAAGTGLLGILGYGAYSSFGSQNINNIRAMGTRVVAQFGIVAVGVGYYLYASHGSITDSIGRWMRGEPQQESLQKKLSMQYKMSQKSKGE